MWQQLTALTTVTKSSCLDVAGLADFLLSLLGDVFQTYLSVRHIAQLVTHGKTVEVAKSVLCKIIARKDIIFNKQFRAPIINRQVLIFVDKFCWFFFHQLQVGVLKNICSKNLIYRNFNRNSLNGYWRFSIWMWISLKKTYNKYELLRTCFSRILVTDKDTNIVENICLTEQSFLNKITTGCLLNFSFLEVCMHLTANFICNDTIFERIFISDFSIWILVFSMLNLHFSVNYKAFQSALAFLIF